MSGIPKDLRRGFDGVFVHGLTLLKTIEYRFPGEKSKEAEQIK
jgi:hypothetical protein